MLVDQVKGVARELETAGVVAVDQERILGACIEKKAVVSQIAHSGRVRHRWQPSAAVRLTDDLPDQVGGNVGQSGGHFD